MMLTVNGLRMLMLRKILNNRKGIRHRRETGQMAGLTLFNEIFFWKESTSFQQVLRC